MSPAFSIIVPIYNVEAYLRECVDSILAQTYPDFELFLVDDGSPDGCGAICDEYAARDSRITVIHQPNRGVTAARRAALDRARADYICFVDADDSVIPRWLETIHTCLSENGWPDMLVFGLEQWEDDGSHRLRLPQPAPGLYDRPRLEREIFPYMLYNDRKPFYARLFLGYLWTKVFRRPLLAAHFQQDERISQYEDTSMLYSCIYAANSLYVLPESLYTYRHRMGSASWRRDGGYMQNLRLCLDYMLSHLGVEAPETTPQIHAYILWRVYNLAADPLKNGCSFRQAVGVYRAGLWASGLPQTLRGAGLPFFQRVFLLTLKLRLFSAAVLLISLRLRLGRFLQKRRAK